MENSRLYGARLDNADLSDANLSNARLTGDRLSATRLYANLSNADLSNTDLTWARISGTTLVRSVLIGVKAFDFLDCKGANMEESLIDNKDLIGYMIQQGAINVPSVLTGVETLIDGLKERNYSEKI